MNIKFSEENYGSNYKCTLLIYLLRNFSKLEQHFNINYHKEVNNQYINNNENLKKKKIKSKSPSNIDFNQNKLIVNNQNFTNIFNNNNKNNLFRFSSKTAYNPFNQNYLNNTNPNIFVNLGSLNSDLPSEDNKNSLKEKDHSKASIFNNTEISKIFDNLISFGANIMEKDSYGLDILNYIIKENNYELLKFIYYNYKGQVLYDQIDNEGKSLIHHVICPIKGAFFESKDILLFLISNGFKYDIKDSYNKTPLDYCFEKKTDYFINIFKELKIISEEDINVQKSNLVQLNEQNNQDLIKINKENHINYHQETDYEKDAEILINQNLVNNKHIKENLILPDSIGNFDIKNNFVFKEIKEINSVYKTIDLYDCTLTNVNIMNGIHGQYIFYKMQLIHDVSRNIYVLWNRWGMIGETGAYQRTPFISLNDAKTEFKKIFKSKTGNEWENKESKNSILLFFRKYF